MSLVQAGEYILEAKLGEGGMGAVFRGRHPNLPGKSFAVKILGGNLSEVAAARFKREMEVLGSLPSNPYVVTIHGGDASAERPYYVMELVEGPSLGKLSKGGTLDPRRAAELVRDAARGIAHAHSHGVLHRDLKPENILVAADGTARVCDFGLARTFDSSRLTMSGAFVGTPHFASPEQLAGDGKEVDTPADIYGLGGLLYFALVGHVPFEETAMERLIARLMSEPPAPPSRERPGVPAALDAICLRALEKAPDDRYQTADDLAADLDAFLAGRAVTVVTDNDARSKKRKTVAIAATLLLLGGTAGGLLVRSRVTTTRAFEAALAANDPAGVEAQLDDLARSGAAEEALAPLRRRIVELSRAAVERPGATPVEIDESLARLERHARDRAARDEALVGLMASIVSAAPRAGEQGLIRRKVARIALACPEALNLVGEGAGPIPGGLADFALAPRDAEASERLAAIASARLRSKPADAAAHALRAYAALSRLGAPMRAFGPGTLGAPLADLETVLEDLAAAAALPGPLGARAAMLRVDLLVGAGSAAASRAREALDALPVSPGTEVARADFESVLAVPPPLEEPASALFARLVKETAAGDRRAPFVLSRLFALWDAPSAIEWPELAADPTDDAIARALAHDDEARFALAPPPPERDDAEADDATPEERAKGLKKTQFRKKQRLAEIRETIQGGLTLTPRDASLLYKAGSRIWDRLTRCIFLWLEAPAMLRTASLNQCFSRAARELTHVADSKSLGPKWDVSSREFDARLLDEVAEDELLQACIANGVPADEVATIARGMGGMKRLEELEERAAQRGAPAGGAEPTADAERSRLAFTALQRLDQLARLPAPALLPFRARARSQALGAPFGDALAALDLDRAQRVASRISSPVPDTACYLFVAAAAAATCPDASLARTRWERLYDLGLRWHRETELASREVADLTQAVAVREDTLKARHIEHRDLIALQPGFVDLARLRGRERLEEDFALTPEDRSRIQKPRPFTPPR